MRINRPPNESQIIGTKLFKPSKGKQKVYKWTETSVCQPRLLSFSMTLHGFTFHPNCHMAAASQKLTSRWLWKILSVFLCDAGHCQLVHGHLAVLEDFEGMRMNGKNTWLWLEGCTVSLFRVRPCTVYNQPCMNSCLDYAWDIHTAPRYHFHCLKT